MTPVRIFSIICADSHIDFLMASISQVAAGGKLFNVVVDTENTGKQLLQNGKLQRRVTIIPLNKIQANTVPPRVQHAAAKAVSDYLAQC